MTGFEPWTSGIGSNHSTNWATTTAFFIFLYLSFLSIYHSYRSIDRCDGCLSILHIPYYFESATATHLKTIHDHLIHIQPFQRLSMSLTRGFRVKPKPDFRIRGSALTWWLAASEQRTVTIVGSITVLLDSRWTGLDSVVSVHTNNGKVFGREPWASGYGRRLTFWRSWVQILALYTGWKFFQINFL